MLGNMNPKQMEKMMRQMGMKTEEIEAREVIIRCQDKDIVITSPAVQKINMMGNDSFQVSGVVEEKTNGPFSKDDVAMVVEQTGSTEKEATDTLEKTKGDLAEAILLLSSN